MNLSLSLVRLGDAPSVRSHQKSTPNAKLRALKVADYAGISTVAGNENAATTCR
jgi:hypothetical protein